MDQITTRLKEVIKAWNGIIYSEDTEDLQKRRIQYIKDFRALLSHDKHVRDVQAAALKP